MRTCPCIMWNVDVEHQCTPTHVRCGRSQFPNCAKPASVLAAGFCTRYSLLLEYLARPSVGVGTGAPADPVLWAVVVYRSTIFFWWPGSAAQTVAATSTCRPDVPMHAANLLLLLPTAAKPGAPCAAESAGLQGDPTDSTVAPQYYSTLHGRALTTVGADPRTRPLVRSTKTCAWKGVGCGRAGGRVSGWPAQAGAQAGTVVAGSRLARC
jgi:hypothetical protein